MKRVGNPKVVIMCSNKWSLYIIEIGVLTIKSLYFYVNKTWKPSFIVSLKVGAHKF
jgi:hypothetical protein